MSGSLWTAGEAADAVRGETALPRETPIAGISIDTRTLQPGEAFVAIQGHAMDGHQFVAAAFEAGASCAIVSKDYAGAGEGRLIRVGDPFAALQDLGRAARARATNTRIIAVTGSAGKTGTKEALRVALSPSGSVHASARSYNNHWGVPLSLSNMPRDTAFGVFEAGMNHAGELTPLSLMIRPHIAVVTTVEPVHLGHFGSVEEIADAKGEIFEGLEPRGVAILNADNPHFGRLRARAEAKGARIVSFGEKNGTDIHLAGVALDSGGSDVDVVIHGRTLRYRLGAPGRHLVQNSLAVLGAVAAAGADLDRAAAALAAWQAPAGRGAWRVFDRPGGEIAIIDEAYNANPASMRAALAILGLAPRRRYARRIAVLGDMLELGPEAQSFHSGLADAVDAAGVDVVFACGALMEGLYAALPREKQGGYAKAAEDLTPILKKALAPGDVVMVKGSYGSRLAPVVEALTEYLDQGAS